MVEGHATLVVACLVVTLCVGAVGVPGQPRDVKPTDSRLNTPRTLQGMVLPPEELRQDDDALKRVREQGSMLSRGYQPAASCQINEQDRLLALCPNGCTGRGICLLTTQTCQCYQGWVGNDCSVACEPGMENCKHLTNKKCPNGCNNHGQCINGRCNCYPGFIGDDCGEVGCPRDCSFHGKCTKDGVCVCDNGYGGEDCSKELCPNGCHGRGRCVSGRCICNARFSGVDCSLVQSTALAFDGSDDFVRIPHEYSTSDAHVELWLRSQAEYSRANRNSHENGYLFGVSTYNPNADRGARERRTMVYGARINAAGRLVWRVKTTTPSERWQGIESRTVLRPNTWYHIYFGFSNTDTFEIWINGRLDASTRMTYANIPKLGKVPPLLTLGTSLEAGVVSPGFRGTLAEVRVWSKRPDESRLRGEWQKHLTGSEPDLIGYWALDEGRGSSLRDMSSRRRDGITVGNPRWTNDGPMIAKV